MTPPRPPRPPGAPLLSDPPPPADPASWRARAYGVVFRSDTPAGRAFDLALITAIVASVAVVMLESVASVRARHYDVLRALEWFFTLLFTVEFGLRLAIVSHPTRYVRSFYGAVDLLAILPFYVSLFFPGAQYLLVVRLLRILRIFRVLKLVHYLDEASTISTALLASRRKIGVFMFTVVTLVTVLGALMYFVEGGQNGFSSIPTSVYWAVVTLTTVGYGDISPVTPLGKFVATVIMLLGYGILAVPTGIVSAEFNRAAQSPSASLLPPSPLACPRHPAVAHAADASFCRLCATALAPRSPTAPLAPPPDPPPSDPP